MLDTTPHQVKATIDFKIQGLRQADITPVGVVMTRDGKTAWVSLGKANHVAEVDRYFLFWQLPSVSPSQATAQKCGCLYH